MEKPRITALLFALVLGATVAAQTGNPREFEYTAGDSTYTMKQYIFCLYLTGDQRDATQDRATEIQNQHLAHLASLEEKGLIAAGPFGDNTEKRGVLLFDVETMEEAENLVKSDPAVLHGRLNFECHPLWLAKGTLLK